MSNTLILIHFDATTVSNQYNDGQEYLHSTIANSWKDFTGGFFNSSHCDPMWFVGKGRGLNGTGGIPTPRHFTDVVYMRGNSAAMVLLNELGTKKFCDLWLEEDVYYLKRIFEKRGVSNFRLEVGKQ